MAVNSPGMKKAINNSAVGLELPNHFPPSFRMLQEGTFMARKKKSNMHGQKAKIFFCVAYFTNRLSLFR
jgi:hypothetical protein